MTYVQSAGLRDREYAKLEAVQAGSKTGVVTKGAYDTIKTYTFPPAKLTSAVGSLTVYSDYALNGVIKRISVDTLNWADTGSIWIKESGTHIQNEILQQISGTTAYGSKRPVYPCEYPTYTASGTTNYTAMQVGSPDTMIPLVITEKIVIEGSGLGTGKSGLIVIDYQ